MNAPWLIIASYRRSSTYGSLAYDLDALARERQLDDGEAPGEEAAGKHSRRYDTSGAEVRRRRPRCVRHRWWCWGRW